MRIGKKLKEWAVHWAGATNDGFGEYTFDPATEHKVRWQEKQETFIDFDGEEQVSQAIVYMEDSVARKGSWLLRSRLSALDSDHDNPKVIDDAFPIKGIQESPNLRNKQALRKVYL